ncbi:hypothetical protein T484DRAFT_1940061 [Baffinella frigidus]|nr:hypothetical protein T484DRAFT_1940061 [Cryptophyta sp. CCMP2293]
MEARALCDIPAGSEMCISYLDQAGELGPGGRDARRAELLERYGFMCGCAVCVD